MVGKLTMQTVSSAAQFQRLQEQPLLLVLFGGAHCGVCQAIKPGIESLAAQRFARLALAYVDCEQTPDVCAQNGVFTLPVVKLYVQGRLSFEMARSFSLKELASRIERIYGLWQESGA